MNNWIPLNEMVVGKRYKVESRTFDPQEAVWDGKNFTGITYDFGRLCEGTELHWDSHPRYGTCKPIEIINEQE